MSVECECKIVACDNWEGRSPDRPTRRTAPRHRKADGRTKTQGVRLRRVGRSGDRPSQLSHALVIARASYRTRQFRCCIFRSPENRFNPKPVFGFCARRGSASGSAGILPAEWGEHPAPHVGASLATPCLRCVTAPSLNASFPIAGVASDAPT